MSCFGGRGKKTALEAWKSYPDVTDVFLALAYKPLEVSNRCVEHLDRFVVLMYDQTSSKTLVNDARKLELCLLKREELWMPSHQQEQLQWDTPSALHIKLGSAGDKHYCPV